MLLYINKNHSGLYIDANEYSSEGRFYAELLTTSGETTPSFDFVTFRMFSQDLQEKVSLTFGKEALDKLIPMLEKVISNYKSKRESVLIKN